MLLQERGHGRGNRVHRPKTIAVPGHSAEEVVFNTARLN